MAADSKFSNFLGQLSDKLQEQAWFQQLRAKWDELDPSHQLLVKFGGLAATCLAVLFFVMGSVIKVKSLKSELAAKTELRMMIKAAVDEIQRLQVSGRMGGADGGNWPSYVQSVAGGAGIDPASIETGTEKPGGTTASSKESLFDVKIKHVNIRQILRLAFQLETGSQPVKIRNLSIESEDPEGYVNGTLAVSAFELKKQ